MAATQGIIFIPGAQTTGTNLSAVQSAQSTAIPVSAIGKGPRFIQLVCNSNSGAHVKLTNSTSVVATLSDWLVTATPVNLESKGFQYLSYIADTSTVTLNVGITELW